ncbi:MAG: hypothetical protein JSV80_01530, partial [Acidobacteriota bacterium]
LVGGRQPELLEVAADAKPRMRVPLGGIAADPVDLDRDALGHLYILDAAAPAVIVLSADGQLLTRFELPTEGEATLARATCLAVDRAGRLAVHETRRERVQWFR